MLTIDNIFPIANQNDRILQPHSMQRTISYATYVSESESRVVFRKQVSKGVSTLTYEYENIMTWEYRMIEAFFRRQKGRYNDFYVVDWNDPYYVTDVESGLDLTLDRVTNLYATTGYIGNTVLLYNTNYDPRNAETDKLLLTIDEISSTTVTFNEDPSDLRYTSSIVYILYPVIFAVDTLDPKTKDMAITNSSQYIPGYGTQNIKGPIIDIKVSFTQLGVLPV